MPRVLPEYKEGDKIPPMKLKDFIKLVEARRELEQKKGGK